MAKMCTAMLAITMLLGVVLMSYPAEGGITDFFGNIKDGIVNAMSCNKYDNTPNVVCWKDDEQRAKLQCTGCTTAELFTYEHGIYETCHCCKCIRWARRFATTVRSSWTTTKCTFAYNESIKHLKLNSFYSLNIEGHFTITAFSIILALQHFLKAELWKSN